MLIVDPLNEKGHFEFNKNFISLISHDYSILACKNQKLRSSDGFRENHYHKALLNKRFRAIYSLNQILIALYSVIVCKRRGEEIALYLCYDLFAMAVISHVFHIFNIKLYLLEHNTFVPDSNLKLRMFKLISKHAKHITLAPYISHKIERLNKNTVSIWFPLRKIEATIVNDDKPQQIFFMPSSTIPSDLMQVIEEAVSQQSDVLLFCKGSIQSKYSNIVKAPHFENFDSLLKSSAGVIIPQSFDYRVSGVFFEALCTSASIFMADCRFAREMKKTFPNRVKVVSDWRHLATSSNSLYSLNTSEWNESIKKVLANEIR